jgi:hypothetical protein
MIKLLGKIKNFLSALSSLIGDSSASDNGSNYHRWIEIGSA